MDNRLNELSTFLAQNVIALRALRNMTQAALAKLAGIPRSTIAYVESGAGNPSLQNLMRIALSLQVSLDELLSAPRGRYKLVKNAEVTVTSRGRNSSVQVYELLPDPIPGMHMDRMEFQANGRMAGSPHIQGTKEYLTCLQGEVTVRTGREVFRLEKGDVLAFPGDQPHAYENTGTGRATCISVVVLAPVGL
jgi:transcriptional regulator with XRE-family HTH domain